MKGSMLCAAVLCLVLAGPLSAAPPVPVTVYAAGSLRDVVDELTHAAGPVLGIDVQASFGGSGLLRERIEKGESPDLFLSADVGSPRKLEDAGRMLVPVVPFAQNRMCIVSLREAGLTADNLVERLLNPRLRIKTSTPVADPSGDYAWAIFDRIEALHPGAGTVLKQKAQAAMTVKPASTAPGTNAYAALLTARQVDAGITYCSGVPALQQAAPDVASLPVPAALDPHPLFALAVLSGKPQALQLALFLLSRKGQEILAHQGLVPLTSP